jgi:hypothetical protein
MSKPNGIRTSTKVAQKASKALRAKSASKDTKSIAGIALANRAKRS